MSCGKTRKLWVSLFIPAPSLLQVCGHIQGVPALRSQPQGHLQLTQPVRQQEALPQGWSVPAGVPRRGPGHWWWSQLQCGSGGRCSQTPCVMSPSAPVRQPHLGRQKRSCTAKYHIFHKIYLLVPAVPSSGGTQPLHPGWKASNTSTISTKGKLLLPA